MRGSLITRIPNDGAQQAAFGAAFQDVNGCAAHLSGQNRATFQGIYHLVLALLRLKATPLS